MSKKKKSKVGEKVSHSCNKEVIQQTAQELGMNESLVKSVIRSFFAEATTIMQSGDRRTVRMNKIGRFQHNDLRFDATVNQVAEANENGTFRIKQRRLFGEGKQSMDSHDTGTKKDMGEG